MVREAVQGGSVPESYMKELHRLASTSDRLELETSEGIDRSVVFIREGKVYVDGEVFDHVILATGSSSAPGLTPLYKQVEVEFGLRTVDNYPLLDDGLSWMPNGEDLFVVGANAVLELGPGALNLMGAMRGGRIVAEGLRDLMWSTTHRKAASAAVTANQFSLLGLDGSDDSDDSDESDGSDGSDGGGNDGIDDSDDDIDDDGAQLLVAAVPVAPTLRSASPLYAEGRTSPFSLIPPHYPHCRWVPTATAQRALPLGVMGL